MGSPSEIGSGDASIGKLPSVGGPESELPINYQHIGLAAKDEIEKSAKEPPPSNLECDKPKLFGTNSDVGIQGIIKEIETNPWSAPSYIAVFLSIMYDFMSQQSKLKLSDAERELSIRLAGLKLSTEGAVLTGEMTKKQAYEKMVQAITSFVNAGVSGASAMQTARNLGKAESDYQKKIDEKQTKVDTLKKEEATKVLDPGGKNPPSDQDIEAFLNDKSQKYSDDVKKAQDDLDMTVAKREESINQKLYTLNTLNQAATEAFKSAVNGFSSAMQASITLERGKDEMNKAFLDGLIQALRSWGSTASESHSDSKSQLDGIASMISRTIESTGRAHSLKQSG